MSNHRFLLEELKRTPPEQRHIELVERKGTSAPWNHRQRLVVQGVYRHVRNPMIAGVFFVLFWEAALAASLPLLVWFIVFVLSNVIYIPLAEEPGLVGRFGDDYLAYRQNVPRWIPRPWDGRNRQ